MLQSLALSFLVPMFAHADPALTKDEYSRLMQMTDNPLIIRCSVTYEFDAFLDAFGLSASVETPQSKDGSALDDERKEEQLRSFLNKGKLTLRRDRPKDAVDLTKRLQHDCNVIALAVLEAKALEIKAVAEHLQIAPENGKKLKGEQHL